MKKFNRLISDVNKPFALVLIVMGLNCAYSVNAAAVLNPVCCLEISTSNLSKSFSFFYIFRLVI